MVDARETIGRTLSELERLSDQVKQLEIQCQVQFGPDTHEHTDARLSVPAVACYYALWSF